MQAMQKMQGKVQMRPGMQRTAAAVPRPTRVQAVNKEQLAVEGDAPSRQRRGSLPCSWKDTPAQLCASQRLVATLPSAHDAALIP
eukprot:1154561-Pelagomonas_calceolata.AAC.6